MYESRRHPPLSRPHFIRRLVLHFASAMGLVLGSLLLGMVGYATFESLAWLDAFLNAATGIRIRNNNSTMVYL